MEGEQRKDFSTDCPLTNISRLALCIHVQCSCSGSAVADASGPALRSPAERPRGEGMETGSNSGVEGPVGVRGRDIWFCSRGVGLSLSCRTRASSASPRRCLTGVGGEQCRSGAERSSPPGPGQWRGYGLGLRPGRGWRLRRWSWRLRRRRWWCWDLALCCCHLSDERRNYSFQTEITGTNDCI